MLSSSINIGQGEQAGPDQRSGQMEDFPLMSSSLINGSSILGSMSSSTSSQTGGRPTLRRSSSFSRKQQVFGVVFLDLDIFVAYHPERVVPHHVHAAEQLIKMMSDHVLGAT